MPINLFRSNGTFSEFKNADYIPAYYFLPREIISMWGKEYRRIPRSFNALINDEKTVALVENPDFMNFLLRSYAYLIWPIMMPSIGREIYSETEPSWAFSHRPHYWIRTLTLQGVINESEFVAERLAYKYFPYPPMDEVLNYLKPAVNVTMRNNNMHEVFFPYGKGFSDSGRVQLVISLIGGTNTITLQNPVATVADSSYIQYKRMGYALKNATKLWSEYTKTPEKPIVFSICEWGTVPVQ